MQSWHVLTIASLYVATLFLIAWWGERSNRLHVPSWTTGIVYCLTLAVYNTAWSFNGSVGRATLGFDFLPIYIGPIVVLLFGQPLLRKIITLAKAYNATSIADFIAIRYGRNQHMAALVTLIALFALLPYIALQLKAVATSFDVLTGASARASDASVHFWQDSAFAVALSMAIFSIMFGVRHIHASEHHRGLMLAIAFESLVKLAVFMAVGAYVIFGMSDGFGAILTKITTDPKLASLFVVDLTQPTWFSNTLVSIIAFLCLPHMFHVAVVENESISDTRRAAWLFPAYLLIFSALMLPIAIVGLTRFGDLINPDTFMVNLPLANGANGIALLSFIGGLSAATGMVIMAAVALSTMICNDVVMPMLLRAHFVEQRRFSGDISRTLIAIRRIAVVAVLMLAYAMHRVIDQRYPLTTIGFLSFVAVAQFGPALIAGLYWRRADRVAAIAGIVAGIAVWAYTLLIPSIAALSPTASDFARLGPYGIEWLRPQALFGTSGLDPISHATFWSLGANTLIFVLLSLMRRQSLGARTQAEAFVSAQPGQTWPMRIGRAVIRLDDLSGLAKRFIGHEYGTTAFAQYLAEQPPSTKKNPASDLADDNAIRFTEKLLAGAVGAASARVIMAASLEGPTLSRSAAMAMLDEASEALHFNRKLLERALESVPQGILVLDADLNVTAWNQRLIALLDIPRDVMRVGLPLSELVAFNKDRGEYGADDLKALLVNRDIEQQSWPYVYVRERPDGTVLETTYDRMPDGGIISTYADVTEKHRAAEALRAARDTLEQRVRERTEALEDARLVAEHANAGKTRFLAAASHDLLQPLNAARLFLAAIQEGPDRHLDNDSRKLVDNASTALRSTEQFLNTLLDISALDSGVTRIQEMSFCVGDLFAQLHLEFSALAANKAVTLSVVPSSRNVYTDPHLLRRVLQNLLSNAVRYTPSGNVLLGARLSGNFLRIEVWDTGIGIPEDRQSEIFEEFHRLQRDDGGQVGYGLGLAIVQRIAYHLRHPIGLRSIFGKGSCFHVTVPMADSADLLADDASDPQFETSLSASNTVLCIDNETAILEGMQALIGRWEHKVVVATDETSALEALGGRVPDVVLIDYHLGRGRSGLDLLDRLRSRWGNDLRALIITADRSDDVVTAAAKRRCLVLEKPVKPASLRRFINGPVQERASGMAE